MMSYGPDNTGRSSLAEVEERHERAFAVWYETMDYGKAAKEVGVSVRQIKEWAERFSWSDRARALTADLQEHWRKVVAEVQVRGAKTLFAAELETVCRLQRIVDKVLAEMENKKNPSVRDLKLLSEVARHLATIAEKLCIPRSPHTTVSVDKRKVVLSGVRPVARLPSPQPAQDALGLAISLPGLSTPVPDETAPPRAS